MRIKIPLWKKGKNPGEVEVEDVDFDFPSAAEAARFPHCDSLILHRPGTCEYCDRYPDRQALRYKQGIAFSNDSASHVQALDLIPCPSTVKRPADVRDRWPGNVPKKGTW